MLRDFPAGRLQYDERTDEARVRVGETGGPTRTVAALLLLDAKGFLVGVDLQGDELERPVVLLGRYEDVARTVPASLGVCFDADGAPGEIVIPGARAAIRAADPSPYGR